MKKVLLAVCALTFMSAFGAGTAHAQIQLNAAIQNSAGELSAAFERNFGVAVLAVYSDSARMSDHIVTEMIVAFMMMQHAHGISVVNRMQLNTFAAQLGFGTADLIDDETAQSIGSRMNVRFVVTGTFEQLAGFFRLSVQVMDVETLAVHGTHVDVQADGMVASLMEIVHVPPVQVAGTHLPTQEHQDPLMHQEPREPRRPREPREPPPPALQDHTRFFSVGASIGFAGTPRVIGAVQTTLSPWRRWFFRLGCDFGFGGGGAGEPGFGGSYEFRFSVTPFAHLAFFAPFGTRGGWYIGTGFSSTRARYRVWSPFGNEHSATRTVGGIDFITGVNIGNRVDISYTLRTHSTSAHRFSVGLTWRFQQRDRPAEAADVGYIEATDSIYITEEANYIYIEGADE